MQGHAQTIAKCASEQPGRFSTRHAAAFAALSGYTAERASSFEPVADGVYVSLTLSTVYHKLVPYCGPSAVTPPANQGPNPETMRCSGAGVNSGSRAAPAVDLTPSADVGRCSGARCQTAARAVRAYHDMLDRISPLRTRYLHSMEAATLPSCMEAASIPGTTTCLTGSRRCARGFSLSSFTTRRYMTVT